MGIINQQVCDGCGTVIFGRNGNVVTKRSYVQFKGQITTHDVDDKTGWVDHRYLTPFENSDLSFCMEKGGLKLDCLMAYLGQRTIIVNNKIEASKRRRATDEMAGREDDGYGGFTVGTKPYKKYGHKEY